MDNEFITRTQSESVYLEWLAKVMMYRPPKNMYLDSDRGIEVGKLCLDFCKKDYAWHRTSPDVFWVDCQLFVKYKLSDEEILFILKQQPDTDNFKEHAEERKAFAEFKRGLDKIRKMV